MIKLLELRFSGVGRFVNEQKIDLRSRDKIIQVDARNLNTGGSSGAGKSTIFKALEYLLGINDVSAKDLQSRVGKNKISVEGDFEIDGNLVVIHRSVKNGLTLKIGEESISGNVKLAEEKLQSLIGIPDKIFKKMIHKKQKEGGFFLKLTAGEMFKLLIKVLNLEHWTDKITKIDKEITELQKKIDNIDNEKKNITSSLEDAEKTLVALVKPVANFDDARIEGLKAQVQALIDDGNNLRCQIEDLKKERDAAVAAIPLPEKPAATVDMSTIEALKIQLTTFKEEKAVFERGLLESKQITQKQIDEMNRQLYAIGTAKKDMVATVDKIKVLKAEKAHIESSQCPTCSQTWVGDSASVKLSQIDKNIQDLAEKAWGYNNLIQDEPRTLEALQTVTDRLKEINAETSKPYDDKITAQTVKIAEEQSKIDNFLANINREFATKMTEYQNITMTVKADFTTRLNDMDRRDMQIASEIKMLKSEIDNHDLQVKSFNAQLANYENSTKVIRASIESKKVQLNEIDDKVAGYKKSQTVAKETKRLIKNYTLQIFQESLDYIGEQATEILSKIPNMSSSSIYFESCRETSDGLLKDEVNAILNMDGENEINIKTLSGGEETAAEMAVDLGFIQMVEEKVGKGADFFIMDEPFTGMDSVNIQNVMDMLMELNSNKKIIIVDHNPEIKALINDRITVVRNGEESTIEQ